VAWSRALDLTIISSLREFGGARKVARAARRARGGAVGHSEEVLRKKWPRRGFVHVESNTCERDF
jgi:hypothetical protein